VIPDDVPVKLVVQDNNVSYIGNLYNIQAVPGGKVNILGGHSNGHSKQKTIYVHVSYSERFPG
jgi:hypothetical protein